MSCCTTAEKNQTRRFEVLYERGQLTVIKEIEKSVFGSDYGANSWTTLRQAKELCAFLSLDRGDRLLDLGSGAGWPGLYIAGQSGCQVTLLDLPLSALKIALDRAVIDGIDHLSLIHI